MIINGASRALIRAMVADISPNLGTVFASKDGEEILQIVDKFKFVEINLTADCMIIPVEEFSERVLAPIIGALMCQKDKHT
jgi:hypothetical protein